MEGNPKSSDRSAKKKEKRVLKKTVKKADKSQQVDIESTVEMKKLLMEAEENETGGMRNPKSKKKTSKGLLGEIDKPERQQEGDGEPVLAGGSGEEPEVNAEGPTEEERLQSDNKSFETSKSKKKKRLLDQASKADHRGVCYLSRIPPHMDHVKLRQILSQYGEIQRIYLAPEGHAAQAPRKRANRKRDGGFQEQVFSEGWVEFTKKGVAKRVANMLNGELIGGRKRSSFYYDLWNIKYLSKFKWDDLTEEIAYKNAIREQKLALEISAAKRERDFYLSKVDKSRALSSIEEELKKKQKVEQEPKTSSELPVTQQVTKVIRQFPQKRPVANNATESKSRLSKDILAGVFGGS